MRRIVFMAAAFRRGDARHRDFPRRAMNRAHELRNEPNEKRRSSYAAQQSDFWSRIVHGPNVN